MKDMVYLAIFIFIMICVAVITKDDSNDNIHNDSRIGSHYEISHRKDN